VQSPTSKQAGESELSDSEVMNPTFNLGRHNWSAVRAVCAQVEMAQNST